jgi:hypothetical protein
MILKYLNFPEIPSNLLDDVDRIISEKNDDLFRFVGGTLDSYKFYPIDGDLEKWLLDNIPIQKTDCFHIHVISDTLLIHKDYNHCRYKLNYVIKTGGDNVITSFYDDNINIIDSYKIVKNKWHHFDGQINHGVTGILPNEIRVGITLGTDKTIQELSCLK